MTGHASSALLLSFALVATTSGVAATPAVELAHEPLYGGRANIHPNLLLSLSVEFPTVGIAYRGDNGTYNRTRTYLGYFNPGKCYRYKGGNRNLEEDAWFEIDSDADSVTHECNGQTFSGNFMNWASSSAIDILRYTLTGGDRVIDQPGLTVLQRAFLQDDVGGNFYADEAYFPRRTVKAGTTSSAPGKVTPFDVETLYVVSCRNRILFSDKKSNVVGGSANASAYCVAPYDGTGNAPAQAVDKALGEYLVRVRVCDGQEGAERTELCMKYGAHYKPVGELQRNADRVRVGAMGYLLDDAPERYGGVLRAPLKYLGAKRHLPPGYAASANDRPEWDPETGVFYNNPEDPLNKNDAANTSGVANYLNKFGRNGRYKTNDPVSELYYEGLRYLQGKQPSPEATAGMSEAMRDGFPVLTEWADPVMASCQRNHILVIADVNTHWDRYIPGNVRTKWGNNNNAFDAARPVDAQVAGKPPALDVKSWTRKVGEMEVDADGVYGHPAPNTSLAGLDAEDAGAGGHGTYYMAGLAYWANTQHIRIDKPVHVKTFAIDVDEGGDGKIDGNKRVLKPRNSQLYLAAKYGGFDDRNGDGNPFITIDVDGKTVIKSSNKEWDNGGGVPANYFLAGQPTEMVEAIHRVFGMIGSSSGTLSGAGLSSSRLGAGGAYLFQPGFDPSRWSGSLHKLAIGFDENSGLTIGSSPVWDAGAILTGTAKQAARPSPEQREIHTLVADGQGYKTAPFKWDQLDEVLKMALDTGPGSDKPDGLGKDRLAWLRGVRERELGQKNGVFRTRDRVLGDIVGSNPLYVGPPVARASGEGYAQYLAVTKDRAAVVYVGANDGMLHAFNADTGIELFAYVPRTLVPLLPQLAAPGYVHRLYVDGGLAAADARVGGKWKTVLVGAFGAGAQGVFALDVSDPTQFGAGGVLLEFTDADDPDMGNVSGAPQIARFRTGVSGGVSVYRDFLVVASGLNNYVPDGLGRHNEDAAGALFLLALDKGSAESWKAGVNYYKFRLPAAETFAPNGLAQPVLVPGADGAVRVAFLGDLQGNLWRIDFSSVAPWSGALGDGMPLFVARDDAGRRQPITTRPLAAFAPGGGYLVMFGTGKYVEAQDGAPGTYRTQSFYAVHDAGVAVVGRASLVQRIFTLQPDGTYLVSGDVPAYGSGAKKGWYIDFPHSEESGERVVSNAVLRDGIIYFNTVIPDADPCAAGGGASYEIGALTGLPPNGMPTRHVSRVGMLGEPIVLDLSAVVGRRNAIGERVVQQRRQVVNVGTGGENGVVSGAESGPSSIDLRAGRFSWREILNWRELRDALLSN